MADIADLAPAEALAARAEEAARLLRSLGNPRRLQVLCALEDGEPGGEMTVSELNQRVNLSQSALSQHLAQLREEGLVATRREAQRVYYRLQGERASRVIALLKDLFCGGQS